MRLQVPGFYPRGGKWKNQEQTGSPGSRSRIWQVATPMAEALAQGPGWVSGLPQKAPALVGSQVGLGDQIPRRSFHDCSRGWSHPAASITETHVGNPARPSFPTSECPLCALLCEPAAQPGRQCSQCPGEFLLGSFYGRNDEPRRLEDASSFLPPPCSFPSPSSAAHSGSSGPGISLWTHCPPGCAPAAVTVVVEL